MSEPTDRGGTGEGIRSTPERERIDREASEGFESPRLSPARFVCSICGYDPENRANWCALGCGHDYVHMSVIVDDGKARA